MNPIVPANYNAKFKYKKSYNRIAGENEENDSLSDLVNNKVSFSVLLILSCTFFDIKYCFR